MVGGEGEKKDEKSEKDSGDAEGGGAAEQAAAGGSTDNLKKLIQVYTKAVFQTAEIKKLEKTLSSIAKTVTGIHKALGGQSKKNAKLLDLANKFKGKFEGGGGKPPAGGAGGAGKAQATMPAGAGGGKAGMVMAAVGAAGGGGDDKGNMIGEILRSYCFNWNWYSSFMDYGYETTA